MSAEMNKTILLVEDEMISAMAGKITLENYGNKVITAFSGEEAVETVGKNPAIDLVLMDINLGGGIDGTEAAEIILKNRDLPVVFLSGHTEPEMVGKTEKITSYGYVVKNSDATVLDASIKMAFKLFEAKTREKERESQLEAALEALRESEEKYRTVADFTYDWEAWRAPDGTYRYVSPSCERISGHTAAEFLADAGLMIRITHPEDQAAIIEHFRATANETKKQDLEFDFRILTAKGETRWLSHLCTAVYGEDGRWLGRRESNRDITERKQAEAALKISEALFRGLYDNMKSGSAIFTVINNGSKGSDYIIKKINNAGLKMEEKTLAEVAGKKLSDIRPAIDSYGLIPLMKKVRETGKAAVLSTKLYIDERCSNYYENYIFKLPSGEIVTLYDDVTERKMIEEELRESEERYRTLFENTGTSTIIIEEDGTINLVNEEFVRHTGYARSEIEGVKKWTEIVDREDIERMTTQHQLRCENPRDALASYEFRFRTKSGELRNALIHVQLLPGTKKSVASIIDITLRKQAEDALQESEVKLRAILDATPFPIALVDTQDDKIDFWSRSALTLFGHTAPTATEWYQIAYPDPGYRRDVVARWKPFLEKARKSGQAVNTGEYRVTCRDGSVSICEMYAAFLANYLIVTFNDISERKQAESQREAALEKLRSFALAVESSSDAIGMSTPDGRHYYQNKAFEDLFGDIGENPPATVYVDEQVGREVLRTIMGGNPAAGEIKMKGKAGELLDVFQRAYPINDSAGKILGLVGVHTNITERKQAEKALSESEVRFRELFNRMSSGVAVYEAVDDGGDFIIRNFNPAAEKIEKVSREDVLGKRVSEVFPGTKAFGVFKVFQRVWRTGEAEYFPENLYKPDGGAGDWRESWRENWVFKLPSGEIVTIYNDISERKQAGEEIQQQLKEKEVLLREVHHRIKNNIASIGGLITLQMHSVSNPEAIAVLQDAVGRVNSMRILYDKLLLTEGYKDVSVKNYVESLIASVVALFPDNAKVTIDQQIADFQLDQKRLSPLGIIINELLTNIMKHAFINRDSGLIKISLTHIDKHATLTIQDDGNGLPPGFEINESKGFGLMLVKMLSQQLGGSFSIEKHQGTRCRLVFVV